MMTDPVHNELGSIRRRMSHGEGRTQVELDALADQLAPLHARLRPKDKKEPLPLFDALGSTLGTTAPRWLCHLLALRHRCAHVLLIWPSPALGDALVLQIRNWSKDDSPGHLDISVGGHMTVKNPDPRDEMVEELNLSPADLESTLVPVGGYPFDEERPQDHFFNSEWRDVYIARLRADAIGKIRFGDGEVAGVLLVPARDARRLLKQDTVPMASALRASLPQCLAILNAG